MLREGCDAELLRSGRRVLRDRVNIPDRAADSGSIPGPKSSRSNQALAVRERCRNHWSDPRAIPDSLLSLCADLRDLRRGSDLSLPLGGRLSVAWPGRPGGNGDLYRVPTGCLRLRLAQARPRVDVGWARRRM